MKISKIKLIGLIIFITTTLISCQGQAVKTQPNNEISGSRKLVGGGCDGCELMYVGMPKVINSVDTSAGWYEKGQKILLTGTVYKIDGKTPAPNVIIYYWQTDNDGYYSPKNGMNENAKRHGHIRGWVKSDEGGKYKI